jgi:hypothetical protein
MRKIVSFHRSEDYPKSLVSGRFPVTPAGRVELTQNPVSRNSAFSDGNHLPGKPLYGQIRNIKEERYAERERFLGYGSLSAPGAWT